MGYVGALFYFIKAFAVAVVILKVLGINKDNMNEFLKLN